VSLIAGPPKTHAAPTLRISDSGFGSRLLTEFQASLLASFSLMQGHMAFMQVAI
jgi:hypothetical protein